MNRTDQNMGSGCVEAMLPDTENRPSEEVILGADELCEKEINDILYESYCG